MPHITLEMTCNVDLNASEFFSKLTHRIAQTGHAEAIGLKCQVVRSDDFYIIDGQDDNKMVNLLIRLREGRSEDVLAKFSEIGMTLMQEYFADEISAKKIILSTEIKELKKGRDLTINYFR